MRHLPLMLFALIAAACGRTESTEKLTLEMRKVERINECHVILDDAGGNVDISVGLRFACGVPSSALTENNWWGDQAEPSGFTIQVGDCVSLNRIFYCLEEIEPGKSASFKATYKQERIRFSPRYERVVGGDLLEEIQEGRTHYHADDKP